MDVITFYLSKYEKALWLYASQFTSNWRYQSCKWQHKIHDLFSIIGFMLIMQNSWTTARPTSMLSTKKNKTKKNKKKKKKKKKTESK